MSDNSKKKPNFPILKGESVGASGEFSGKVVLVSVVEELNQSWTSDVVVCLHLDLEKHFKQNPGILDNLFKQVSAVLTEFGEPIGEISALAHIREIIAIVKIPDACYVLENDMHIRIIAHENSGEIFFID